MRVKGTILVSMIEDTSLLNAAIPMVSVIVPIYNAAEFLPTVITSLLNQTRHDIEILLINDCSTDNTCQLCAEYTKMDDRVHSWNFQTHKGVSEARNFGMRNAKGRYISFVDADDWLEPDMIDYMVNLIEYEKADISTCSIFKEYNGITKKKKPFDNQVFYDWKSVIDEINYDGKIDVFLFDKLFRRDLLEDIWFSKEVTIGEDYRFLMKVLLKKPVVVYGNERKYHYRQRRDSASHCGFSTPRSVLTNIYNYQKTFQLLVSADEDLRDGALAYYILQEMAVLISMAKANVYEKSIACSVQKEVRNNLIDYLKIERVPLYLKGCAILLSIHVKLLLVPYRLFGAHIRRV